MSLSVRDQVQKYIQSAYQRITLTRITLAFIVFSLSHCIAQFLLQGFIASIDFQADGFTKDILSVANVPRENLPWHTMHKIGDVTVHDLKICSQVPGTAPQDTCIEVFNSAVGVNGTGLGDNWIAPSGFRKRSENSTFHLTSTSKTSLQPSRNSTGGINGAILTVADGGGSVVLNEQCTRVLLYAHQMFADAKRESLVLLVAQFWLFGMSFLAITSDSIPHLLAIFTVRVFALSWSAYTIFRSNDLQEKFQALIFGPNTPCHTNLFPDYVKQRLILQIPDLVLNCTGLLLTAYLGWLLIKAFSAHTFKRIGPPEAVIRIYHFYLMIFVHLYMAFFLMVTSMSLWIDQLINSAIASISSHSTLYHALFIFTMITIIPWILLCSFGVKRENRIAMGIFLGLCFTYVACWGIMFYSQVYRWTWIQWPFFACMTVTSFIVFIGSGILGIICWLNFNNGLAQYLRAEESLAKADFAPSRFSTDLENPVSAVFFRAGSSNSHYYPNSANPWTHARKSSIDALGGPSEKSEMPIAPLTLMRDTNWDFNSDEGMGGRPPVFVVDLEGANSKFRELQNHDEKDHEDEEHDEESVIDISHRQQQGRVRGAGIQRQGGTGNGDSLRSVEEERSRDTASTVNGSVIVIAHHQQSERNPWSE